MSSSRRTLELSIIERLREGDDVGGGEDELREALRRDIEALLNSHRRFLPTPKNLQHVASSMLNFGVPDFSNEGYSTKDHKELLRAEIERSIARNEPRLHGVRVELVESRESAVLRFRITAHARIADSVESVAFSTAVEPVDWSVNVDPLE